MNELILVIRHSKQLLIATVCCAVSFFSEAQQTVANKTFIQDRPTMLFSSVEVNADTFFVLGVITGVPNNTAKGMIAKIDKQIQFNNYSSIGDSINADYGLFWNTLMQNTNDEFVFAGYCTDTLASILLGIASIGLDSIAINRIYYPGQTGGFQAYSIVQSIHGGYYLSGGRTNVMNGNTDAFLLKVDSNLQQEWIRFYNQLIFNYAKAVTTLNNGNLLLGAMRSNSAQVNQTANTWLLEVDTGGNVVRQWFDPSDSTYVAEGLRQTQDGGFIYGAQKKGEQTINDVYKTATIVKLDSSFNKQWVFNGGSISSYTSITDMEELADGSIIACGNKPFYETDSNTVSGWIIKLTANGSVVWERIYRGINETGTLNLLSDIDILPDGGLIAVGQCQKSGATPPQVGWFLKLDSNGCEIENCTVGLEEIYGGKQLEVYPNPTKDYFIIESSSDTIELNVVVYDVYGNVVVERREEKFKQLTIDTKGWASGFYLWSVVAKGKKGERGKINVLRW